MSVILNQEQYFELLAVLLNYFFSLFFFSLVLSPPPTSYPVSQAGRLTGLSEVIETKLHVYCTLIRFPLVMIKGI